MKHLKKFEKFLENTKPAPSRPSPGAPVTTPVRRDKPKKPTIPIPRPSVDPDPKAEVTENDVAMRFIEEMEEIGESVKKYL